GGQVDLELIGRTGSWADARLGVQRGVGHAQGEAQRAALPRRQGRQLAAVHTAGLVVEVNGGAPGHGEVGQRFGFGGHYHRLRFGFRLRLWLWSNHRLRFWFRFWFRLRLRSHNGRRQHLHVHLLGEPPGAQRGWYRVLAYEPARGRQYEYQRRVGGELALHRHCAERLQALGQGDAE